MLTFTKTDKKTLEFIVNNLQIPSLQRIADGMGISKSAANKRVERLRMQGKIKIKTKKG